MLKSDDNEDIVTTSEEPDFINPYLSNTKCQVPTEPPPTSDIEANLFTTTIYSKRVGTNYYFQRPRPFFVTTQPRKANLESLLSNLLRSYRKRSVCIHTKNVRFRCHMIALQSFCTFFIERYNAKRIRLPSSEVTPAAFLSIYYWILSDGDARIQRSGLVEMFNAANFLGIRELLDQCWFCFDNVSLFQENSAFTLYLETIEFDTKGLQELMLSRICKYFLTIVASKEFLHLNEKSVVCLLQMSNIGVNSEMEVFMACIRWLDHDWINRHASLLNLLRCVRFKMLPPLFLRYLQSKQNTRILFHLTKCEEIKIEINKAFIYVTKELYEKSNGTLRYDLSNSKCSEQRRWIFDKMCPYHHNLNCPKRQFLTYDDFVDYLLNLQKTNLDYHQKIHLIKDNGTFKCCSNTDNYLMSLH